MNVLEKILEEIEDHAIEFESFGMCADQHKGNETGSRRSFC